MPIILDTVNIAGNDRIGRTAVQKIIYFLNEKKSLGIKYKAYYYGPFSQEISENLDLLTTYGYLIEKRNDDDNGVDFRSYAYSLTDEGRRYLDREMDPYVESLKLIIDSYWDILNNNLKYLSYSAKYHFIEKNLNSKGLVCEKDEVLRKYKWEIPVISVDSIIDFIGKIGVEV